VTKLASAPKAPAAHPSRRSDVESLGPTVARHREGLDGEAHSFEEREVPIAPQARRRYLRTLIATLSAELAALDTGKGPPVPDPVWNAVGEALAPLDGPLDLDGLRSVAEAIPALLEPIAARVDPARAEELPADLRAARARDALEALRAVVLDRQTAGLDGAALRDGPAFGLARVRLAEASRALALGPPPRQSIFTIDDIFKNLPPPRWICEGLQWCPGRPCIEVGYPGSGKTLAIQSAALSIVTGRPIWGTGSPFRPARIGRVIHVDYDQGEGPTRRRYRRLMEGMGVDRAELGRCADLLSIPEAELLVIDDSPKALRLQSLDPTAIDAFERAWTERLRGFDLAIVDSLRRLAPFLDENDSRFASILEGLRRASDLTGCTVVLIHHAGKKKPTTGRPSPTNQAGRGTSAIDGESGSRHVIEVENPDDPGPDQRRKVSHVKASVESEGSTGAPFYLAFVDGDPEANPRPLEIVYQTAEQVHPPKKPGAELAADMARVLTYIEGENRERRGVPGGNGIAEALKIRRQRISAVLERLEVDGAIVNRPVRDRGMKPRWWVAALAPPLLPGMAEEPTKPSKAKGRPSKAPPVTGEASAPPLAPDAALAPPGAPEGELDGSPLD